MQRSLLAQGAVIAAVLGASAAGGALVPDLSGPSVSNRPLDPSRIVSATLATDEILLSLLPAERIAAVSIFADDERVSNVVSLARAVRGRVRGPAEQIFAHSPTVVFSDPILRTETQELLAMAAIPLVRLPMCTRLSDVSHNIRTVGDAVGQPERAARLVRELEERIASTRRRVAGRRRPSVLLYNRGGYTAGAGTLFDDMLEAAGGSNAAARVGLVGHVPIGVEQALAIEADLLLVTDYRADGHERGLFAPLDIADDPLWQASTAVREGRIASIAARHLMSTSQFAAEAVVDLSRALHPDVWNGR